MPDDIQRVDEYAEQILGIPTKRLMRRAGDALAAAIERAVPSGGFVVILTGFGNNGGDGYAAGILLMQKGYRVLVVDVFARGQKTEAGKTFLAEYKALPEALLLSFSETETADEFLGKDDLQTYIYNADAIIDAVFGTGYTGELPPVALTILSFLQKRPKNSYLLAADVPLGVSSSTGGVSPFAVEYNETVMLSYPKLGLYSYPARGYSGKLTVDDLGLPKEKINAHFGFSYRVMDDGEVKEWLPKRAKNSHKGSYGQLGMLVGSQAYTGAAMLAVGGAMRTGVGLVRLFSEESLKTPLLSSTPELLFTGISPLSTWSKEDAHRFFEDKKMSAWLVGSGSGVSDGLAHCLEALLTEGGEPLVLDADALNTLALPQYNLLPLLKNAKREVVLTPHPLEFARILQTTVDDVNDNRLSLAASFAQEYQVTLLLKGAASLTATKEGHVYINTTGSSALSKGGSGDVLAGAVSSFIAQGVPSAQAAALAAYLHGRAGDALALLYSEYGVMPSELAAAMAKEIAYCLS